MGLDFLKIKTVMDMRYFYKLSGDLKGFSKEISKHFYESNKEHLIEDGHQPYETPNNEVDESKVLTSDDIIEFKKCMKDPKYFIRKYCHIIKKQS